MSTPIENNTEELRNILQQVNELPEEGVDTPSDAVRYTEQSLTPEQQAQARANIDAMAASELPEAVNDALAQANASGEFKGEKGDTGKTAYQYAKEGGYTGTETAFAEKLAQEYPTKLSQLDNDSGFITGYTETDPTVPAWAKAASKPSYTASEVGALPNTTKIPSKTSDLTNDSGFITGYTETDPTVPGWAKASSKPSYSKSEVGLGNVENVKQYSANNPPPYPVTSVNGKTGAVTLDAAAVGARPSSWTPTAANVGAVPTSRKVNGKALSADITLSAADVRAVPQTETMKLEGVDADGVSHVFTIYGVTGWSGADDPK